MGLKPFSATPKQLDVEDVLAADWVITMGCGEACPIFPGKRYEDWGVMDPSEQPPNVARGIRDDISQRIDDLLFRISRA